MLFRSLLEEGIMNAREFKVAVDDIKNLHAQIMAFCAMTSVDEAQANKILRKIGAYEKLWEKMQGEEANLTTERLGEIANYDPSPLREILRALIGQRSALDAGAFTAADSGYTASSSSSGSIGATDAHTFSALKIEKVMMPVGIEQVEARGSNGDALPFSSGNIMLSFSSISNIDQKFPSRVEVKERNGSSFSEHSSMSHVNSLSSELSSLADEMVELKDPNRSPSPDDFFMSDVKSLSSERDNVSIKMLFELKDPNRASTPTGMAHTLPTPPEGVSSSLFMRILLDWRFQLFCSALLLAGAAGLTLSPFGIVTVPAAATVAFKAATAVGTAGLLSSTFCYFFKDTAGDAIAPPLPVVPREGCCIN